jgi:hypothetical protein
MSEVMELPEPVKAPILEITFKPVAADKDAKLTDTQRANLEQLADYVESCVVTGESGTKFNMMVFNETPYKIAKEILGDGDRELGPRQIQEINVCGTVACLCGHGPMAIRGSADRYQDWNTYATDVFGANSHYGVNRSVWEWLFDASWTSTDNTPAGGVARIRYALKHGIPWNADDQNKGNAPLCYKVKKVKKT